MANKKTHTITLSRTGLITILLLAVASGGLLTGLLLTDNNTPATAVPQEPLPEPATVIKKQSQAVPKKTEPKPVAKKQTATKPKTKTPAPGFVIKGLISTAGEPWSPRLIRVKLLWLKNKGKQQFLLGHETAQLQMTPQGLAYQFKLKPQPAAYVSFNGGVEGNLARIIAFLDNQQDGRLTAENDKIIAVSKELLRYRTGRYDRAILNDIQEQNIRQAGSGYVFIRREPVKNGELDWQVVADKSPVRLDLDARETSLPAMYNNFLKIR